MALDIAAALDAAPAAGAFFDSLAQFYRDAYLRWIDATERRPEQRPLRIAEMIRLLGRARRNAPVEQSAQAVRLAPVVVLLGLDPRDPQMRSVSANWSGKVERRERTCPTISKRETAQQPRPEQ